MSSNVTFNCQNVFKSYLFLVWSETFNANLYIDTCKEDIEFYFLVHIFSSINFFKWKLAHSTVVVIKSTVLVKRFDFPSFRFPCCAFAELLNLILGKYCYINANFIKSLITDFHVFQMLLFLFMLLKSILKKVMQLSKL